LDEGLNDTAALNAMRVRRLGIYLPLFAENLSRYADRQDGDGLEDEEATVSDSLAL
jgi:hypothetical protein